MAGDLDQGLYSARMDCLIHPFQRLATNQLFKHAQLASVSAWLADPAHAALPLHARIQRAIRHLILEGALQVGQPLPATRALAQSLNVSRDTVESAYGQLHLEGFIERQVGRGSFVSVQVQRAQQSTASRRRSLRKPPVRLSQRGLAIQHAGGVGSSVVSRPFAQGIPETRGFPLQTWERLQRQVLKEHGADALAAAPAQGVEPLRQAIATYVNLERGAQATAERVLILTSSQQALMLSAMVLFDPGERIYIEDPVYHGARRAFDAAGLHCVPIPVDADGMQVHALARAAASSTPAQGVFITPSHQFPTGATLTLARRLALIEWARQHQGWIIEDDYDSEFHYLGRPTACVQGLDEHERTLYVGTFTKSLFPGLRIGYMVLPPPLVAPMTLARTLLDGHSAPIPQLTLARFIEGGHFGAHVRGMRAIYAERLDALAGLVRRYLGDFLDPLVPAGGLQLPCAINCDIAEHRMVDAARSAGIDLMGLTALHASSRHRAGVLMGFAAHTPRELESAVKTLARALRALRR